MIRTGSAALALAYSATLALAQTPPANPPPASAPIGVLPPPGTGPAAAATQNRRQNDVLGLPLHPRRHVGPLRGTPIVDGNPAIRVDGSGQVITSEQP